MEMGERERKREAERRNKEPKRKKLCVELKSITEQYSTNFERSIEITFFLFFFCFGFGTLSLAFKFHAHIHMHKMPAHMNATTTKKQHFHSLAYFLVAVSKLLIYCPHILFFYSLILSIMLHRFTYRPLPMPLRRPPLLLSLYLK